MRATADRLRRLTEAILTSGGSAAAEAALVADHSTRARRSDLRGEAEALVR